MKKSTRAFGAGKARYIGILSALVAALFLTACAAVSGGGVQTRPQGGEAVSSSKKEQTGSSQTGAMQPGPSPTGPLQSGSSQTDSMHDALSEPGSPAPAPSPENLPQAQIPSGFDRAAIPGFTETAWADVNGDVPFFTSEEMEAARQTIEAGGTFQLYGELDGIGRCTGACALVGPETLPQEGREDIRMVKPAGWHTVKYEGIDGNYLYNRCHLIGFQLTGQNANEKNLITGTRFMNIKGMLPFEESVLAYIQGTGKHVLYRVSPVYQEDNLLADGVLMEARSVEDPLVQFCAFCYNVQPGIVIDYATGESEGPAFTGTEGGAAADPQKAPAESPEISSAGRPETEIPSGQTFTGKHWDYIVNVRTGIFHFPSCDSVGKISTINRQGFSGTREELVEMGYQPCGYCRP